MHKDVNKNLQSHSGKLLTTVGKYKVIFCNLCKFNHLTPFPTEKDLEKVYKKNYYTQTKPDYFKKQKKDLKWWNLVYEERINRIEKFMPKNSKKRMLDVGSGPGFFIKYAQSRGFEVLGLEPSLAATEFANRMGAKTIAGFFDREITKNLGKFDVIHMQGVMEHMRNPIESVQAANEILNPGGLFCNIVANDFNPLQMILLQHLNFTPWWVVPSEHINYFSISSLKNLTETAGFRVKNIITTFPIDLFLLMGDNYIGDDEIGRNSHNRRKALEFALVESGNIDLKEKLYKAFADLDIGRDIELIAQKK